MLEGRFIDTLSRIHGTKPYLSDAEIIPQAGGFELVSMDSFSEREDFLHGLTPRQIGRQMAIGACADLLACGAKPETLLQSWIYDDRHGLPFYEDVANGIQEILDFHGAKCIGGDVGAAEDWQWTACVIGHAEAPVRRRTSRRGDFDLYVSGGMGLPNAAIYSGKTLPCFYLRDPVPPEALFATDTSGGFMDALENFRRANHGLQMDIELKTVLSPDVYDCLPAEAQPGWTLVGGVGEYELVFAVPHGHDVRHGTKIGCGCFDDSEENDIRLHGADGCRGHVRHAPPDYRDVPKDQWIAVTAKYWKSLFEQEDGDDAIIV
ncbi:MAG: hypothetical protein IKP87_14080 [Victivallales bacterium]|nr:hypothetical protein [Victivallales bacterium]